ncbi:MAG: sigma-70 family RNA polymerase sigma factor [Gemmatimonadetes bacterium]|nr:sigma-70 family RNA polymerase sigma factor [Gemmatimonadota bacterium]
MADQADKREKDRRFQEAALSCLPDVARFALSLTRDEPDADDLVQETYLRAYRSWDTFEPGTECRAWLFTICRNAFYRMHKREERTVQCDDAELESLAAAAVHSSAEHAGFGDVFARADLHEALEQALNELPDQFREAVVLVDVQDHSYEDAATVIGVPIGTVRSRLYRARRLLQERLLTYAKDAGIAPKEGPSGLERNP